MKTPAIGLPMAGFFLPARVKLIFIGVSRWLMSRSAFDTPSSNETRFRHQVAREPR
jgi:hypothetical protein